MSDEKLEAAARELAAITRENDDGYTARVADISFLALPRPSSTGLQMSPQEWALKDGLPR